MVGHLESPCCIGDLSLTTLLFLSRARLCFIRDYKAFLKMQTEMEDPSPGQTGWHAPLGAPRIVPTCPHIDSMTAGLSFHLGEGLVS